MPRVSLVVPVFNESENIPLLHKEIVDALGQQNIDFELVLVDDHSTDDTPKCISKLVQSDARVRGFRLRCNTHKSGALQLGFAQSSGEVIITLDGDLQDSPAEIPKLLAAIDNDADVAVGWRKIRNDRFVAKLLPSLLINLLTNVLLGQYFHDMNSGFKAYRRDILEHLTFQGSLFRFIPHLLSREGFNVVEVPVEHRPRKHGRSKFSFSHRMRSLFDVCTVFFLARFQDRPLHFFGAIGSVVFLIGVLSGIYLTSLWWQGISIGNRPLLLFSLLMLIVGVQIASVGLMGELLVQTRSNHKKQVAYSVL
jgi:glycosyltransferase involved in cell wall biosynthesis